MKKTVIVAVFAAFFAGCGSGSTTSSTQVEKEGVVQLEAGQTWTIDGNYTSATQVPTVSGDSNLYVQCDNCTVNVNQDSNNGSGNTTTSTTTTTDVNNTDNTSVPTIVEQPQPVIVTYTTPVSVQL